MKWCDKEEPKTQDLWLSQFALIVERSHEILHIDSIGTSQRHSDNASKPTSNAQVQAPHEPPRQVRPAGARLGGRERRDGRRGRARRAADEGEGLAGGRPHRAGAAEGVEAVPRVLDVSRVLQGVGQS